MNETTKIPRREFGHIFQRGARYWVRYRADGRTYRESTGSTDRRKAEKLLATREVELRVPGAFTAPDAKRTRFQDLAQMIRDEYVVLARRSNIEFPLKHLTKAFHGARAAAITLDRLTAYVRDRMAEGAAPATIQNELNAAKHAFRLAKRAGKVASIPEFPPLAKAKARVGFFEPDDFAALLRELPAPLKAPVEFAYLTGWRKSEVVGLTWDRVDFEAGMVRLDVGTTKTGEGRTFPFGVLPRLKSLLEAQRAHTKQTQLKADRIIRHVFHREGEPIKDMFAAWRNACERAARDSRGAVVRAQLIGRIFHDLRRTAVRNLVRAGVPEHTAMKLSGHKTRSVFDRYDIVSERDLSQGVAKLASFHGQQAAAR